MQELTIDEIHQATLGILNQVISICDLLGINYYLAFGSLIGAIRHKGFIPWDDDLDIIMLRPDYDRFKTYCLKNENKMMPYKLLCRENTNQYPYNIIRLNDMRYKAVYENIQSYESGVFVDVYPYDDVAELSKNEIKKLDKKRQYLMMMILLSVDDHYEPSKHGKWYRSVVKYLFRSFAKLKGSSYYLNKMENIKRIYSISGGKYISLMTWDTNTVLCEKQWFSNYIITDFENIEVKIPIGYDQFLKLYYGNYMTLPDMKDRVPSHGYRLYKR